MKSKKKSTEEKQLSLIEERKQWIDASSYEELLRKVRYAPAGDVFFSGEVGDYYQAKMKERREEVGNDEHVRASKAIEWSG